MSIAFESAPRARAFHHVLGWLRGPAARISALSDRDLTDIGVRARSLSSSVHREIGKPGLVDFGWRLGR